jgi:hypothetical protein
VGSVLDDPLGRVLHQTTTELAMPLTLNSRDIRALLADGFRFPIGGQHDKLEAPPTDRSAGVFFYFILQPHPRPPTGFFFIGRALKYEVSRVGDIFSSTEPGYRSRLSEVAHLNLRHLALHQVPIPAQPRSGPRSQLLQMADTGAIEPSGVRRADACRCPRADSRQRGGSAPPGSGRVTDEKPPKALIAKELKGSPV